MSTGDQPQQQQQAASKVTNIPNLANSVVNLATLRDQSRKELIDVLDTARGRKAIVLDPQISGPLGLVAEVSLLKDHGVEKIYHLNNGKFETECKNIVYMVRPKVKHMRIIAEHIRQHEMDKQKKEYTLCFVPRRTMICERVLEEEGVYGDIMIAEYQLDLIPFDEDVLSLELDTSYRECLLEGDKTSLYYVARALMKIQSTFGIIPNVKGKGVCSKLVYDMLVRMRKEMGAEEPTVTPEIDTLILIDRDVDMITPCCTQLTYEGLIDEVFQIQNSLIEVDPDIAGATSNQALQGKKVKIPLNCNDKVYHEVRDMNFSQIGPYLNRKAKEIDEYYKSRHGASVSQLRDFTKKLSATQQEHTALRIHTNIAEKILNYTKDPAFRRRLDTEQSLLAGTEYDHCVEYLEECINKKEPLTKVLRLLTLLNLTNGGLKPKQLDFFKREVLQTYGFEYIFTLNNFEKLGLLKKQEGKQSFPLIRKNLGLIVEDLNEATPNDVAYVYSGYAPLSIRLIQQAVRGQWRMQDEVLRSLPGPSFEETQPLPAGIVSQSGGNPVTLVFFIGGVTFTEIAALRYMSLAEQPNRDYLVATTKLIYGDSIIESLVERVEPPRK